MWKDKGISQRDKFFYAKDLKCTEKGEKTSKNQMSATAT